jgi:hypothetical protein
MSSVTTFWKFVEGYEGIYQVSDQGQVRSVARIVDRSHGIPRRVRERLLVPGLTPKGYHAVSLYKGGRRVQAFCGESANGREINHRDGDKSNNRRSNLEYATHPLALHPDCLRRRNGGCRGRVGRADDVRFSLHSLKGSHAQDVP